MDSLNYLENVTTSIKEQYTKARSIMSFSEFMGELSKNPKRYARNAAQFIHDAFLHFGKETPQNEWELPRYKIFDQSVSGQDAGVVGQEHAQNAIYRMLENAVRAGKNHQLLLLHGPNGSGKSSIVSSIIRSLEVFSRTEEGVLYRFNWIFPASKIKKSGIGFGAKDEKGFDLHSYAHLNGDQIDARLTCPMKDHPLFLLPIQERNTYLDSLEENNAFPKDFQRSDYIRNGELSHRSKMIFDTLMIHYGGEFSEVLRHIQVERFYISQRYRHGAVSIEPQMHADAGVRQVTADHSLSNLPKALTTLNLFEPVGALVDANRGILEFSDLLKRPMEAFKYLLSTCETGRVNIEPTILYLDLFLIGNANDLNLEAFQESAEFMSFKSRIELVRVPYLLKYEQEKEIYDAQLRISRLPKPTSPHVTKLASLWAVLSRLKKANPDKLPPSVGPMVSTFSALEKAYFYNDGSVPKRFSAEDAKVLKKNRQKIISENVREQFYEGRIGASPREIQSVLLNAAYNKNFQCLTPLALFTELEELVQEKSVYLFLQLEPKDGFHDPVGYIKIVRNVYLEIIDKEFRKCSGIVKPEQHLERFVRYIQHVKGFIQKEKVLNPLTHEYTNPDEDFMKTIEGVLLSDKEKFETFRNEIISKIAATSLEQKTSPGQKNVAVRYDVLFQDYINRLEEDYFNKQSKLLKHLATNCLEVLSSEKSSLSEKDVLQANGIIERFCDLGYPRIALKEELSHLLKKRYEMIQE